MLSIKDFEIRRKAEAARELKQRRERIATALMAGMFAGRYCHSRMVSEALDFTDDLIKALDEVKE